jgi:hypothetical protein
MQGGRAPLPAEASALYCALVQAHRDAQAAERERPNMPHPLAHWAARRYPHSKAGS